MENNFQKIIFKEVLDFFKPIIDTQGDPDEIINLFYDAGWDMDTLLGSNESDFVTIISGIINTIEDVKAIIDNPPDSFSELLKDIEKVTPLFTAIKSISSSSVINNITNAPRISELPSDAINLLMARYLHAKSPFLFRFLEMIEIISFKSGDPVLLNGNIIHVPQRSIHFYFEVLGEFFSDPAAYLKGIYWPNGIPNLTEANKAALRIFPSIANLLATININAFIGRGVGPNVLSDEEELRLQGLMTLMFPYYLPDTDTSGSVDITLGLLPEDEQGPGIYVVPSGSVTLALPFEQWLLNFEADAQIDGFSIGKSGFNIYQGSGNLNQFSTQISLAKHADDNSKALLIGSVSSTRFEIGKIEFGGGVSINAARQEFLVFARFTDCLIVIAASEGDSILKTILGENGINIKFDLKIGWSNIAGFHIEGSGCLEISLPVNISIGPIEIKNATVALRPKNSALPLELSATLKGSLGPVTAVIENIGINLITTFPSAGGNLGPLNLQTEFKPPNGIGLALDVEAVTAAGFLKIDRDKGEYVGAIEIKISAISLRVAAIGIINTKPLDGSIDPNYFSLLIIITAEFPPIALGYGFTLNGLGGLFGYKRTMRTEELRAGIKAKTLDSILFPKDVVKNIGSVVNDLQRVFPAITDEHFLIGPMVKIGWGNSIITAEIGVIIEIPSPVIAILGVVRLSLPADKEILHLQINFLGVIDFNKKLLSIDAALEDSRVLCLTLTGQFALRIGWGSTPVFIFSSGGFHPDFKEAPVELQKMTRLGIQILDEEKVKLGVDSYFALTTNTVQFGAHVNFWASTAGYTATANIGFDALMQFNPFAITIGLQIYGRVTGPAVDTVVDVHATLTGPNPWHVWGYATLKLFVDITIPFDTTFGNPIEELTPETIDVSTLCDMLADEVAKDSNWKAETLPYNTNGVTIRNTPVKPGDPMIIHPNTTLSFSQRLIPLEVPIDKFGNNPITKDNNGNKLPVAARQFSIDGGQNITAKTPLSDLFPPGNFLDIPKDRKLSTPSFETMQSGKELTVNVYGQQPVMEKLKDIDYEVTYVTNDDKPPSGLGAALSGIAVMKLAAGSAASRSKLSSENTRSSFQAPLKATINKPAYNIVQKSNLQTVTNTDPVTNKAYPIAPFGSQAEAYNNQPMYGLQNTIITSTFES